MAARSAGLAFLIEFAFFLWQQYQHPEAHAPLRYWLLRIDLHAHFFQQMWGIQIATYLLAAAVFVFGARRMLLVPLALCAWTFFGTFVMHPHIFPEAAWPWLAITPTLCALSITNARLTKTQHETLCTNYVRGMVLIILFFVAFHKLNTDHFLAGISCGDTLIDYIQASLDVPQWLFAPLHHSQGVLLEVIVFACFFFAPRVGIFLIAALLTFFGLAGAVTITVMVTALLPTFFTDRDIERITQNARILRAQIFFTASLITVGIIQVHTNSILSYQDITLFTFVFTSVLYTNAWLVIRHMQTGQSFLRALTDRDGLLHWPHPIRIHRYLWIITMCVLTVNCLTPYMGLKFNFSLSMWSNLRADESRWNHLIMPRSLQHNDILEQYVSVDSITLIPRPFHHSGKQQWPRAQLGKILQRYQHSANHITMAIVDNGIPYQYVGAATGTPLKRWTYETSNADAPPTVEVHELHIALHPTALDDIEYWAQLTPDYFEASHFRDVVRKHSHLAADINLRWSYRGNNYAAPNARNSEILADFLQNTETSNWIQKKITRNGPQACVH